MASTSRTVWVPNPAPSSESPFVKGRILNRVDECHSLVSSESDGEIVVPNAQLFEVNSAISTGELSDLSHLHEAAILHHLKTRFMRHEPYTLAYGICLAVNPFQWHSNLYTSSVQDAFSRADNSSQAHVYQISSTAYDSLLKSESDQSILISGESGAGKTETTKILMQHLARLSSPANNQIVQRVLLSNPVLEAFGNARTVRNDNSSRFGKYIRLEFSKTSRDLQGATISTYLLEKSRIVSQAGPERNYHILYQLVQGGLHPGFSAKYFPSQQHFRILNANNQKNVDIERGRKTMDAFHALGFAEKDIDSIVSLLGAVVLLGEVDFEDEKKRLSVEILHKVEELLHCSLSLDTFTSRTVTVGAETYQVQLENSEAKASTDTLIKSLYSGLFNYVVEKLNSTIAPAKGDCRTIGILDLFGFESFKENSLEQLCINFANEKLQQIFNESVLAETQAEYNREGLAWSHIEFSDGSMVIDLIQNNIFKGLQEESVRPNGSSKSFSAKLQSHEKLKLDRFDAHLFTVSHYAAPVTYNATLFLEKNCDRLHGDVVRGILSTCSNTFVKSLVEKIVPSSSVVGSTLTKQFKSQLNSLAKSIGQTESQFVRCIKPNDTFCPDTFHEMSCLQQLRCSGVIEAIRIARTGYPDRLLHQQVVSRFGAARTKLETIMPRWSIPNDQYFIGKTKVFFKGGALREMMLALERERNAKAVLIQKLARKRLAQNIMLRIKSALRMQRFVRGVRFRQQFIQFKRAVVFLQSMQRRKTQRKWYISTLVGVVRIQALYRSFHVRQQTFLKHVVYLQASLRKLVARRQFCREKLQAIQVQKHMRGFKCRRHFKRMLAKVREENNVKFLQDKVDKMENEMQLLREENHKLKKRCKLLLNKRTQTRKGKLTANVVVRDKENTPSLANKLPATSSVLKGIVDGGESFIQGLKEVGHFIIEELEPPTSTAARQRTSTNTRSKPTPKPKVKTKSKKPNPTTIKSHIITPVGREMSVLATRPNLKTE